MHSCISLSELHLGGAFAPPRLSGLTNYYFVSSMSPTLINRKVSLCPPCLYFLDTAMLVYTCLQYTTTYTLRCNQAITGTYIFYGNICNIHILYASGKYLLTYTFTCKCAISLVPRPSWGGRGAWYTLYTLIALAHKFPDIPGIPY